MGALLPERPLTFEEFKRNPHAGWDQLARLKRRNRVVRRAIWFMWILAAISFLLPLALTLIR